MKRFFNFVLLIVTIVSIVYFVFVKIFNNNDEYDMLYEKYSKDSNFECKLFKCTSDSFVDINDINFSLTKDLNVNDRAYYFKFKNKDILFSGAYNLIDGKEKRGVVFPIQITFVFNVGEIHYTGIYHVSDRNLALTPQYSNYDISNYMMHKSIANKICEYIVDTVKNDLET